MTSRTRKLMVGAAVAVGVVVVGLLVFSKPNRGLPIRLTFLHYDEGVEGAVLQLENISDFGIVFNCSTTPKGRSISRSANLSPSEVQELTVPGLEFDHAGPPGRIIARCWRVPTGIRYRVWRALQVVGFDSRQKWETSIDLPPLPKPSP